MMAWPLYVDVDSYEEFRAAGRGGSDERGLRHHRVIAYAYGMLDSLDDSREVDHLIPIRWLNYEANLEAVDPADHGRRTRSRETARKAAANHRTLDGFGVSE